MKTITLSALREQVERRKVAIGWIDDESSTNALRNSGIARSPAKRQMLSEIEVRARNAGRKPVVSNY
ncbi:hypothetical protein [Novosphingobium sediminicola]|uniref:Uncharacterized protein n=1 Tax=Novosphingobium sediminicola TaxID=563162 RepID=A0A7W6CR61_9SPHN|nr:hypothetical protein [Novosphingobium sediminicola]MBB3957636.1 hypothetical protein [Novosphingobium sediminicola]